MMRQTLVIIPAFNEEKNIGQIVQGIKKEFPDLNVLVINDGSTDRTGEIARQFGATVLTHASNMGYGVALQTGYKFAARRPEYERVVQLDGDGQHDYRDIPALLQPLFENRADVVIGSRYLASENVYRMPLIRRLGMLFFRSLLYLLTKKKIKDITSGMQAFNKSVLATYVSDDFPYYYPDANVLLLQLQRGLSLQEVPSAMAKNKEGKSMHRGLGHQIYYVASMSLSILVLVIKNLRRKHAP